MSAPPAWWCLQFSKTIFYDEVLVSLFAFFDRRCGCGY
jgi:hypothetical protein